MVNIAKKEESFTKHEDSLQSEARYFLLWKCDHDKHKKANLFTVISNGSPFILATFSLDFNFKLSVKNITFLHLASKMMLSFYHKYMLFHLNHNDD